MTTDVAAQPNMAVMNSIKEKMSLAFLLGLNSTVNYAIDEAGKDYDGLGVDYRAANRTVGVGRKAVSPINELNIQLKAVSIDSKSMVEVHEDHIRYNLTNSLTAINRHYIFVIILPKESELPTWREIDDEQLILNAKGYYYRVEGTLKAGFINIPITDMLTHDSFKSLFDTDVPLEFTL